MLLHSSTGVALWLTLRCARPAAAGFACFRRLWNSNVSRHMRAAVLAAVLLALSSFAHPASTARPVGKNCSLTEPPLEAGEDMNHGEVLRIYPRAKTIGAEYTGCQVLFAPHGKNWQVVSLTEVVKGEPVRVWSEHQPDESLLACRYKNGKLIAGNPDKCPRVGFLLLKSLAPGCAKLMQEAVAKQGLAAKGPAQCEYE